MDNASNNDTFMETLEVILTADRIPFHKSERRIRYVFTFFISDEIIKKYLYSCFPHIVNLAVKAVLGTITKIELARVDAEEYDPTTAETTDSIAQLRTLIRKVYLIYY